MTGICSYCGRVRNEMEGWHENCEQSRDAKARIESQIEDMRRIADHETRTSELWTPERKKRLGDMAQNILLSGGKVKPKGHDDDGDE